jgi:hypothetical protein
MVELAALRLRQHEPDVAAHEERERAGFEEELEPECVPVEGNGAVDVVDADGDLPDARDWCRHVVLPGYR